MSTDTFEAELDDILGELTSDFTKKRKKRNLHQNLERTLNKPQNIGAVYETVRTIMKSPNTITKRPCIYLSRHGSETSRTSSNCTT